jgi:hypothetical protein
VSAGARWRTLCLAVVAIGASAASSPGSVTSRWWPVAESAQAPASEAGASGAGPALRLTATPSLMPAYQAALLDYTVACEPQGAVTVRASVPRRETLSIDGGPPLRGSIERRLRLQAGEAFTFTVGGSSGSVTHDVRCTPLDFPRWTVHGSGLPAARWIIFGPDQGPYNVITDSHGTPVWWMRSPSGDTTNASVLPDGDVAWWNAGTISGDTNEGYDTIRKLNGSLVDTLTASTSDGHGEVGANLHDLQELANGDFLLIANAPSSVPSLAPYGGRHQPGIVVDSIIQEVTPSGKLLWSWDTANHIKPSETDWGFAHSPGSWKGKKAYDIIHMNSIQMIETGGCAVAPTKTSPATCDIVFSARHLDAVYSISMATGKINWKLGGTEVPGESLKFVGDPYGDFGGQHDARILANGTLTLFDNGTRARRPPRAVSYRLGPHTATLINQITDPSIHTSTCCGSATLLPEGDWLIDWGGDPVISEFTHTGHQVLTLVLHSVFSYRALPVTAPKVTRRALIAAMNEMFASRSPIHR